MEALSPRSGRALQEFRLRGQAAPAGTRRGHRRVPFLPGVRPQRQGGGRRPVPRAARIEPPGLLDAGDGRVARNRHARPPDRGRDQPRGHRDQRGLVQGGGGHGPPAHRDHLAYRHPLDELARRRVRHRRRLRYLAAVRARQRCPHGRRVVGAVPRRALPHHRRGVAPVTDPGAVYTRATPGHPARVRAALAAERAPGRRPLGGRSHADPIVAPVGARRQAQRPARDAQSPP